MPPAPVTQPSTPLTLAPTPQQVPPAPATVMPAPLAPAPVIPAPVTVSPAEDPPARPEVQRQPWSSPDQLDIGHVMQTALDMYGSHAGVLFAGAVFAYTLVALIQAMIMQSMDIHSFSSYAGTSSAGASIAQSIVICHAFAVIRRDRDVSLGGALQHMKYARIPLYLANLALALSGMLAVYGAIYLPKITNLPDPGASIGNLLLFIATMFVGAAPGVLIFIRLSLAPAAVLAEKVSISEAIRRSSEMVSGSMIAVGALLVAVAFMPIALQSAVQSLLEMGLQGLSAATVTVVSSVIAAALLAPFAAFAWLIAYYDLIYVRTGERGKLPASLSWR